MSHKESATFKARTSTNIVRVPRLLEPQSQDSEGKTHLEKRRARGEGMAKVAGARVHAHERCKD